MAIADGVSRLHTALGSVTNAGCVSASSPKLQEITAKKRSGSQVDRTPNSGASEDATGIVNPLPSLNQLFDRVLSVPGVAELLKPTIEVLEATLRC